MSRPNGSIKTPGSGRKKGTPNKTTQDLHAICERMGINPFEAMLKMSQTAEKEEVRLAALKECAQYLYAKRSAVAVSTEDDKGLRIIVEDYTKK